MFRLLYIFFLHIFRVSFYFASYWHAVYDLEPEMHNDAQNGRFFFLFCALCVPWLPNFWFRTYSQSIDDVNDCGFFSFVLWMRSVEAMEYVGLHKFKFITLVFSSAYLQIRIHFMRNTVYWPGWSVGRLLLMWVMFT